MSDVTDFTEVKNLIEEQGRAWQAFKDNQDQQIKSAAAGVFDALYEEKSAAINDSLNEIQETLRKIQAKSQRVGISESADDTAVEHRKSYLNWLRKGDDSGLADLEVKALSTTVPADGGYAVPEVLDREIVQRLLDISPVRSVAQVVQIGTSDYRKIAAIGGTASGWVGETDARPETATSAFAQIVPTMGEVYANPRSTQIMLDDAFFNVEAWIADEISKEFARAENAAFISGNGTNRPTGFLTGTPVATADSVRAWGVLQYTPSGQAAALPTSPDAFVTLVHTLKAGHRANSRWMMSKDLLGSVRKYKSTDGQYLWQPSLQAGVPSTFLGYPVVEAEDMPAVAANTFPVAFGDFQAGYLIVDRMGVRMIRDPYTSKPNVLFYATKRVGGIVQNSEAIKLLKIATS